MGGGVVVSVEGKGEIGESGEGDYEVDDDDDDATASMAEEETSATA